MDLTDTSSEVIHTNTEVYFSSLLDGIHRARISIEMESYIFENSDIGNQVIQALCEAAQRGVSVRLLVDGAGIDDDFVSYAQRLRKHGASVRLYHPFPWHWRVWPLSITPAKGFKKFWYLFASINKRNHRKQLIIDRRSILLGSFNISQKHLPKTQGGEGWHDTAVECRDIETKVPRDAFDRAWHHWRWHKNRKRRKTIEYFASPFLLNDTRLRRKKNRIALLSQINTAKHRIWICNAYFVPDQALIQCLVQASDRGVDVRILVPRHSDVRFIPWITSVFYRPLLSHKVRIFEFPERMLHSKFLIIDQWASIGSSNFNRRSLLHDLEIDYVLQRQQNIEQLLQHFEQDANHSQEQTIDSIKRIPFWKGLLGKILLTLFGYWV